MISTYSIIVSRAPSEHSNNLWDRENQHMLERTLSVCFVQLTFAISCQQWCPRSLVKFRISALRFSTVHGSEQPVPNTSNRTIYQVILLRVMSNGTLHRDLDVTYELIPKYTLHR